MYYLKRHLKSEMSAIFFKMTATQYVADSVCFAVVIYCGTLWFFNCGTWIPQNVDIIQGSHSLYTYEKFRFHSNGNSNSNGNKTR